MDEYQQGSLELIKEFCKVRNMKLFENDEHKTELLYFNDDTDDPQLNWITGVPLKGNPVPVKGWTETPEPEPDLCKIILWLEEFTPEKNLDKFLELIARVRYFQWPQNDFTKAYSNDVFVNWEDEVDLETCWHHTSISWSKFGAPFRGSKVTLVFGMCYCS